MWQPSRNCHGGRCSRPAGPRRGRGSGRSRRRCVQPARILRLQRPGIVRGVPVPGTSWSKVFHRWKQISESVGSAVCRRGLGKVRVTAAQSHRRIAERGEYDHDAGAARPGRRGLAGLDQRANTSPPTRKSRSSAGRLRSSYTATEGRYYAEDRAGLRAGAARISGTSLASARIFRKRARYPVI
jgi:hypothetical protein